MKNKSYEKLVMNCEICESEMVALHGFFVTCPNFCEEDQEAEKKNSGACKEENENL